MFRRAAWVRAESSPRLAKFRPRLVPGPNRACPTFPFREQGHIRNSKRFDAEIAEAGDPGPILAEVELLPVNLDALPRLGAVEI